MFEELNLSAPTNTGDWRVDASNFEYRNISDLEFDKTYMVCGIYMYKGSGNYAIKSHGILSIIDLDTSIGYRVNLPIRYNYLVKQINSAEKYKVGINNEKCGVIFEKALTKKEHICYNVKLIDL